MTKLDFPSQVDLQQKVSAWAHDLRSPFNHVLGFSKLVLNGQSGPVTDEQKKDLTIVYHSALRTLSLVNNLIEIARLQRGEKQASRAPVDLSALLDGIVDQWRKNNPAIEMPIAVFLPEPIPSAALDKQQMGWILGGFFSYLAAYAAGTGHLSVEVSREQESLLFDLRLGSITKIGHDHIMQEMFGLICRAYVELQGGEIRLGEADEGQARIQFAVPAVAQ
ncbi:MAG: sensor histidine kinase [Chloroflexota bacterium]